VSRFCGIDTASTNGLDGLCRGLQIDSVELCSVILRGELKVLLGARHLQRSELKAYRATYGWLAGRDIAHSRLAGTIHGFVLSRLERRRPTGAIQVQGRVMFLDAMDSLNIN
jgi:hypothetical protein